MSDASAPPPEKKPAKNNDKRNEKLKKILGAFVHPMAIGTYLAIIFAYTAFYYYQSRDEIERSGIFLRMISDFDQKTIDYRLKFRGERATSPQVAVLAVDDRSLDIEGRWPWPREKLARALDNAYKAGAKVIAADVVWSEPSDRPEVRLVDAIDKASPLPPNIKNQFAQKLAETDSDAQFANFIANHAKNFVLGNFFSGPVEWQNVDDPNWGYSVPCTDIVMKGTPYGKMVESQATPLVVIDAAEQDLPEEIAQGYEPVFQGLEEDVRKTNHPPTNNSEKFLLDQTILRAKLDFCDRHFLNPQDDPVAQDLQANWATIKSAVPALTASSFDEWANGMKAHNLPNAIPETREWTINIPDVATKSQTHGYFNANLDHDGTIRRTQLVARTGSKYMPSIALQAYLVATDQHVELKVDAHDKLPNLKGIKKFSIVNSDGDPQFDVPVTTEGYMVINYAGRAHQIPHASIADLLDENKKTIHITERILKNGKWENKPKDANDEDQNEVSKKEFFKDKILVLGATAVGVYDLRVTPFDENYPGVETHANVIDNLLRKDLLAHAKNEDLWMTLTMLLVGLLVSFALARFGAVSGLIFAIAIAIAIVFTDRYFLFGKGVLVSSGLPLIQVFATYMFLTTYKYFTEERSKKELRGTFSKYVSPAIVEEVLRDPKNLELGGRKERITVFFSDVRGFTTISEKLDPRALSDLLNSYLTPMTELVFKNKGTLDKYMGDAVMAFFGAPIHYPDHAKYACRCALQSLEKLKELHIEYDRKGLPRIDIGIGLNTGECSVGNMGSQTVRNYTVMGDAVNLASRLEGINKEYGTRIIISENTYAEVKNDFLCREVDWVRVKGKLQPVKIYELIAEGKGAQNYIEMAKYFADGYQKYHEKQFDQAIQQFEKAIGVRAEDKTSRLYIERCQEFIAEAPPENWDGVYVMKTK